MGRTARKIGALTMKLVPIILSLVFHSINSGDAAVNCYQCKTVQAKGTCETAVKCTGDFCLSYEARTVKDSKLIKSYACAPDGVNSQGTSSGKVCQTQKFDLPGKEFFEDKLFTKEMKTCICKGEKCNTSEADETNGG